jgi:hypothetical protein
MCDQPLLWLIYMDDVREALAVVLGVQVSFYVDDLALCVQGSDLAPLAKRMQMAMDALEVWCTK